MRGALAERRVHQYMRIACRAAELQEIETHDIPAPRAKGGVLGDVDLTAVDHRRSAVIAIGFPRVLGGEGAVSGGWFQHSNEIPVLEFGPGATGQLRRGRKIFVVHWPFSSHRRYRGGADRLRADPADRAGRPEPDHRHRPGADAVGLPVAVGFAHRGRPAADGSRRPGLTVRNLETRTD